LFTDNNRWNTKTTSQRTL